MLRVNSTILMYSKSSSHISHVCIFACGRFVFYFRMAQLLPASPPHQQRRWCGVDTMRCAEIMLGGKKRNNAPNGQQLGCREAETGKWCSRVHGGKPAHTTTKKQVGINELKTKQNCILILLSMSLGFPRCGVQRCIWQ